MVLISATVLLQIFDLDFVTTLSTFEMLSTCVRACMCACTSSVWPGQLCFPGGLKMLYVFKGFV